MKKRMLSLLLASALMLGLVVLPASAAPNAVFVTVNTQSSIVGQTLIWTLNVDPATSNMQTKVDVYRNGIKVHTGDVKSGTVHSYTPVAAGEYYAKAFAIDKSDLISVTKDSAKTQVKLRPAPSITSVAVNSATRLRIGWTPVAGVDGYRVYISESIAGPYKYKAASASTSALLTYLQPGKRYFFYVAGYNFVNNVRTTTTLDSAIRNGVPVGPVSIATLTNPSAGRVRLTWAAAAGARSYFIFRSTSYGGSYAKIGSTTALSFTDLNVTRWRTYYYRIQPIARIYSTNYPGIMSPIRSIRVTR